MYLTRRFFRLFPIYIVTLGFAIAIRPLIAVVMDKGIVYPYMIPIWSSDVNYFWYHLGAHLLMLHGAIPQFILPGADTTLLIPSWSISVEWQFYLIAPILIGFAIRRGFTGLFIMLAGFMALLPIGRAQLNPLFSLTGFLPTKLPLFLLGILCYCIYSSRLKTYSWLLLLALSILGSNMTPAFIWLLVFSALLAAKNGSPIPYLGSTLRSRWLQRLGEISYSTYLVHMSWIWICSWMLTHFQLDTYQRLTILVLVVVPVTYLSAELLFRFLEKPGIRLGRAIARRSSGGSRSRH